ncbi:MAG: prephenate dehydrogenase/arogenate dehydrogenase family protein [Streptosporangiales bacterium]|nr:prephenate dehydrogenase/arogenate dehydrogenase family protein [Streptosporangiales bacterium]
MRSNAACSLKQLHAIPGGATMGQSVAVIGLGNMGGRSAVRLLGAGASVSGYDPLPAARDKAADAGVRAFDSAAAAIEGADVVLLSVPMPADVLATAHDLLAELPASTIVVDISTIDPATAREAAEIVGASGATYLETPVLGRPEACGEWTLVAGGPADKIGQVRELLEASIAKAMVHAGEIGSGSTVKLLNNLMFGAINAVTAEVLNVARQAGVPPERFISIVKDSGAATVSPLFRHVGSRVSDEDFSPNFGLSLLQKDNRLALQLARSVGGPTFVGNSVDQVNTLAADQQWGGDDTTVVYKLYQLLSATDG